MERIRTYLIKKAYTSYGMDGILLLKKRTTFPSRETVV